jgi:hypothetical protein
VNAGGGGVLYTDGSASGSIAPSETDKPNFVAHPTNWDFLSEDTINVCFDIDFTGLRRDGWTVMHRPVPRRT